jgi:glycosyltransferase involved in cell wall biosynthesis
VTAAYARSWPRRSNASDSAIGCSLPAASPTPIDEDYGYVTLEAFLSRKPVITTIDAGGPLEFVMNGVNGAVTEPTALALADAIDRFMTTPRLAASLGDAGFERASRVTWDGVVERLVGAVSRPHDAVTAPVE